MDIKFFVDENIGKNLVVGLLALGYSNIEHISDNFEEGTEDIKWLEYIGEKRLVLITKDKGIRKNPKEKAALIKYKIVAFYLGGKQKSTKEISKQLIISWDKMEACAKRQIKKNLAGAFIIRPRGQTIDEIPLT